MRTSNSDKEAGGEKRGSSIFFLLLFFFFKDPSNKSSWARLEEGKTEAKETS